MRRVVQGGQGVQGGVDAALAHDEHGGQQVGQGAVVAHRGMGEGGERSGGQQEVDGALGKGCGRYWPRQYWLH